MVYFINILHVLKPLIHLSNCIYCFVSIRAFAQLRPLLLKIFHYGIVVYCRLESVLVSFHIHRIPVVNVIAAVFASAALFLERYGQLDRVILVAHGIKLPPADSLCWPADLAFECWSARRRPLASSCFDRRRFRRNNCRFSTEAHTGLRERRYSLLTTTS